MFCTSTPKAFEQLASKQGSISNLLEIGVKKGTASGKNFNFVNNVLSDLVGVINS